MMQFLCIYGEFLLLRILGYMFRKVERWTLWIPSFSVASYIYVSRLLGIVSQNYVSSFRDYDLDYQFVLYFFELRFLSRSDLIIHDYQSCVCRFV